MVLCSLISSHVMEVVFPSNSQCSCSTELICLCAAKNRGIVGIVPGKGTSIGFANDRHGLPSHEGSNPCLSLRWVNPKILRTPSKARHRSVSGEGRGQFSDRRASVALPERVRSVTCIPSGAFLSTTRCVPNGRSAESRNVWVTRFGEKMYEDLEDARKLTGVKDGCQGHGPVGSDGFGEENH